LGDSFYEDTDSSEDEGMPDYKIGGYHCMHVGEVLVSRYVIIQKLGWGHFSTVWLAKDINYNTYVALKIQRSASQYLEAAFDEVEILDQCSSYWMKTEWLDSLKSYYGKNPEKLKNITGNDCYCVQLLNCFLHHGPHGKHFVTVFEILGVNLLEVIKRYNYEGAPLPIVRQMAKQCLIGLDYLHRVCKVIHTDLKPENVSLCLTEKEINEIQSKGQLKISKMDEQ
jgi:serine/threonine-protein kinase SRPK3